jgi:hypothetical protein
MQQSGWRWPLGAALVLALFLLTNSAGAQEALYARIVVDPKTTVYVEFKGEELRMATSVEGLQKAPAVKERRGNTIRFPNSLLPLPNPASPGGFWARVQVGLEVSRDKATGFYHVNAEDSNRTNWDYTLKQEAPVKLGNAPAGAPIIFTVPQPGKATLKITTRINENQVGIALTPMFGKSKIRIRPERKPSVTLRITDSAGKIIANEKGGLDKFGFG